MKIRFWINRIRHIFSIETFILQNISVLTFLLQLLWQLKWQIVKFLIHLFKSRMCTALLTCVITGKYFKPHFNLQMFYKETRFLFLLEFHVPMISERDYYYVHFLVSIYVWVPYTCFIYICIYIYLYIYPIVFSPLVNFNWFRPWLAAKLHSVYIPWRVPCPSLYKTRIKVNIN